MSTFGQWSQRRRPGQRLSSQSGENATCQKCLQKGHWTFMCKNQPVYAKRMSRTKILKHPHLYKREPKEEKPPELLELEQEVLAVEQKNQMMKDLLESCTSNGKQKAAALSSDSGSSSSSSDSDTDLSSSDSDSDSSSSDSSTDSSLTATDSSSDESSANSRRQRERVRLGASSARRPKASKPPDSFEQNQSPAPRHRASRSRSPPVRSSVKSRTYHEFSPTITSRNARNDMIHPDRRRFHSN